MTKEKQEATPDIMNNPEIVAKAVSELKDAVSKPRNSFELSRYQTMEGMQNPEKDSYFTEYIDFNDVLRMNTIEAFVSASMLPLKKISKEKRTKIQNLLERMYIEHVKTHKRNMSSLKRKRETAYVQILSSDMGETPTSTGLQKFLGIGKKK